MRKEPPPHTPRTGATTPGAVLRVSATPGAVLRGAAPHPTRTARGGAASRALAMREEHRRTRRPHHNRCHHTHQPLMEGRRTRPVVLRGDVKRHELWAGREAAGLVGVAQRFVA